MTALKSVTSVKSLKPIPGSYIGDTINGVFDFYTHVPLSVFMTAFTRNKNQRDEEVRNVKHLHVLRPEHLTVHVLQGIDGRLELIDAHTRRMVWGLNPSAAPAFVHVHVFDIVDPVVVFEEESLRLYDNFDSRRAVKTSQQTVQGCMNALDISMKSTWLKKGSFAEAVKAASRLTKCPFSFENDGIGALIEHFQDDLLKFDDILPRQGRFVSPFAAAALIMLRSDKSEKMKQTLISYDRGNEGLMMSLKGNAFYHLNSLRDGGMDGTGITGKGKGKFPTNTGDMDKAIAHILALFIQARDNPTALYDKRAKEISPLSRADISAL